MALREQLYKQFSDWELACWLQSAGDPAIAECSYSSIQDTSFMGKQVRVLRTAHLLMFNAVDLAEAPCQIGFRVQFGGTLEACRRRVSVSDFDSVIAGARL
jgi:hypothetical protein